MADDGILIVEQGDVHVVDHVGLQRSEQRVVDPDELLKLAAAARGVLDCQPDALAVASGLILDGRRDDHILLLEHDSEQRLLVVDLSIGEIPTSRLHVFLGNQILVRELLLPFVVGLCGVVCLLGPFQAEQPVLIVPLVEERARLSPSDVGHGKRHKEHDAE